MVNVETLYYGDNVELANNGRLRVFKKEYPIKGEKNITASLKKEIDRIWREYKDKNLFSIRFYIPQQSGELEIQDELNEPKSLNPHTHQTEV